MRMRKLVVVVVAIVWVAGCTSGGDEAPKTEPSTGNVQTIDPTKATTMKLGNDLEVIAKLPRTMGDQQAFFRGFTPDGKVLGSASLPEKPSGGMGGITTQSHPMMYDPETKKFTVLDNREREEPTQVGGIVSAGDVVVWLETPEAHIAVSEIAIYSYDRRSEKVAQLYSAADPGGIMTWGSDLVITGDRAYFSRFACCRKRDRGNAAVYSVRVDGSAPATVLVEGGQFVTLAGDSLTYEVKDKGFSRDLATGETKPLPVSPRAKDPGFCGAEFTKSYETLCVGDKTQDVDLPVGEGPIKNAILTIKETSGRTTVFKPFPGESLNGPVPRDVVEIGPWIGVTMTDDVGADRKFLVDLDSRAVKAFPEGTSIIAVNEARTQVLMSAFGVGKSSSQTIVQIPPLS